MKPILLATLAAIVIQPFFFFLWFIFPMLAFGAEISLKDSTVLLLYTALVATPFVICIGVPSLFILQYFKKLSLLSFGLIGFIASALPIAILGWSEYSGYSSGGNWYGTHVDFVINGQKTFYGWLNYAQSVLFFGLHGLAGGLIFFFVWRYYLGPNKLLKVARSFHSLTGRATRAP